MGAKKTKTSLADKEQKLIAKLNKAKSELLRLQERKQKTLGALVCKYHLDKLEGPVLAKAFKKLAKELIDGNQ